MTWLFFHKRQEFEGGLRKKDVRLESSKAGIRLETEYCKKECTEGKARIEKGQEKKLVNLMNNTKDLNKENDRKEAKVWPLI